MRRAGTGRAMSHATAGGIAIAAWIAGAACAYASESCAPDMGTTHEVVRVIDGETVVLDDGREVRLIGAMAPRPNSLTVDVATWPPAREAARAAKVLLLNRQVTLRYEGRRQDRYGRVLAQLYARDENGGETWAQQHLVAAGYARAYALPGNTGCVKELMAAEDEARSKGRALWHRGVFRIFAASDVAALLRLVGRFVSVEGRVVDVTRTRQFTYLNFGADWRDDFTVSIRTRAVDRTESGEQRVGALEGRSIRVRGWIERRNGPAIEIRDLDEIEVLGLSLQTAADAASLEVSPVKEKTPRH